MALSILSLPIPPPGHLSGTCHLSVSQQGSDRKTLCMGVGHYSLEAVDYVPFSIVSLKNMPIR